MKFLIADDHPTTRLGVRAVLEKHANYRVVAEAENGREAVELARELQPDVVVLDLVMPVLNGIDAARQIAKHCPDSQVVILTMHPERKFVSEAMEAGARGYITKEATPAEIGTAIKSVLQQRIYISPALRSGGDGSKGVRLTPREREVLQLMAEGNSTKQIALQLKVGAKTIETHRRQIMEKLSIRNVAELTRYAIKEGLTKLS